MALGPVANQVRGTLLARLNKAISLIDTFNIEDFEEFHFCSSSPVAEFHSCDTHDCKTHGNWAGTGEGFFTPHKGRSIAPGQKVKVYRNLHKSGVVYSIKDAKTGLVLGHTPSIVLRNPGFEVSESGRQRVIREKKKNVHSYVTGEYAGPFSPEERRAVLDDKYKEAISYNPYKGASYYSKATGKNLPKNDLGQVVIVDESGVYRLKQEPQPRHNTGKDRTPLLSIQEILTFANPCHVEKGRFGEKDDPKCNSSDFTPVGKRLVTARPTGKTAPNLYDGPRMDVSLISDDMLV